LRGASAKAEEIIMLASCGSLELSVTDQQASLVLPAVQKTFSTESEVFTSVRSPCSTCPL